MAKGPFRLAIEDFLETNPISSALVEWHQRASERYQKYQQMAEDWYANHPEGRVGRKGTWEIDAFVYALTGVESVYTANKELLYTDKTSDFSKYIADKISEAFTKGGPNEVVETLGAVITEPILSLFEKYARADNPDPKEFARAFHGMIFSLTTGAGIIDTVVESATGGQVEGAGRMVQSIYWNLGLGFLGWQTLSPLLNSGLQPNLETYYRKLYRPQRFTATDLRDLFALGEISQDKLQEEAANLGWRPEDIGRWVKLAYRTLSQGDIWALYEKGVLNESQVTSRLRALGYSPSDIPLLFRINADEDEEETKAVALSTAKQAFREQLISESELRSMLKNLKRSDTEINLIVELEKARMEQEIRSLSVSQIKSAWGSNILSDAEATHWLSEEGFGEGEIDILLRTWKVEVAPKYLKLNKGTILSAYIEGILTRSQALEKLVSIGLQEEDARLELNLTELRNAQVFGVAPARPSRYITPSILQELVVSGIINSNVMYDRLLVLGYSEGDAALMTEVAQKKFEEAATPINQNTIERAYLAGVLTRSEAYDKLIDLDFTSENAVVVLETIEIEHPEVFGTDGLQVTRLPTIHSLTTALQNDVITEQQFYQKALELGYRTEDAEMYLSVALKNERKSVKSLTASQVTNAYQKGIFSRGQSMIRLHELGYSDGDAEVLLRLEKEFVSETDTWGAFLNGNLEALDAIQQLYNAGYHLEDIAEAFRNMSLSQIASVNLVQADIEAIISSLVAEV